jgi:hypothetical protein
VILRWRTIALMLVAGAAVGVGVALLAGGGDDEAPPVAGTPKEAVDTVEAFKRALSARDFATVCEELYTVEAREAAGGEDCQSILAQEAAKLRDPEIRIVSLVVNDKGAAVDVEAGQRGERPVRDVIRLTRQRGRFRIASAGPPGGGG